MAELSSRALRSEFLEWLYDQARGRTGEFVSVVEFTSPRGVDLDGAWDLAGFHVDAGLAEDASTFGNPQVALTHAGITTVEGRREHREDPAERAAAARRALLRWFHARHMAGAQMPHVDHFASSDAALFEGSRFSDLEVHHAAAYLADRHLIKQGIRIDQRRGPVRSEITADGMDCVVDWDGNVAAYVNRGATSSITYNNDGPVIHGDVDRAQLAWSNQTVTQTHAEDTQVAPGFEAIAEAVSNVLRRLPEFGLEGEDREDAEAVANEVLTEVIRENPDRGRIRRGLRALRTYLAPVAAATAAGVATGAATEAQEIAQKAVEQLGSLL
jgi:hypothetical protein